MKQGKLGLENRVKCVRRQEPGNGELDKHSVEEKELGVTLKQHRGEKEGRSQAEERASRERRGVSTD